MNRDLQQVGASLYPRCRTTAGLGGTGRLVADSKGNGSQVVMYKCVNSNVARFQLCIGVGDEVPIACFASLWERA